MAIKIEIEMYEEGDGAQSRYRYSGCDDAGWTDSVGQVFDWVRLDALRFERGDFGRPQPVENDPSPSPPISWQFTVEFIPPRRLSESEQADLRLRIGETMKHFRQSLL